MFGLLFFPGWVIDQLNDQTFMLWCTRCTEYEVIFLGVLGSGILSILWHEDYHHA